MAEGARGGITTLDAVLKFMKTTPQYEDAVDLSATTGISA
jgi:hypothetical protein